MRSDWLRARNLTVALSGIGIAAISGLTGYGIGTGELTKRSQAPKSVIQIVLKTAPQSAGTNAIQSNAADDPLDYQVRQMIELVKNENDNSMTRLTEYLSQYKPDARVLNHAVTGHGLNIWRSRGEGKDIIAQEDTPLTILDVAMEWCGEDLVSGRKVVDTLRAMGAKPTRITSRLVEWNVVFIKDGIEDHSGRVRSNNRKLADYHAELAYWRTLQKQNPSSPSGMQ